jgi:hypothetical protein
MRRLQTWLVIVATFGAAGALSPWDGRLRLASAGLAILLIGAVAIMRVRGHYEDLRRSSSADGTWATIERIRAERAKRFQR